VKKISPFLICVIAPILALSAGCATEKSHTALPKNSKIGVLSLLGNSQFILAENAAPIRNISPQQEPHYSHPLPGERLDDKLATHIAQRLKAAGYPNAEAILLPLKANPVQALKSRTDLNFLLVVSPDDGKAPQQVIDPSNDETLFGYGEYFNDSGKVKETFAYLNYDVSLYRSKNLDLLSHEFYSQSQELSFAHFAKKYEDLAPSTVTEFSNWINQTALPIIEIQALDLWDDSVH